MTGIPPQQGWQQSLPPQQYPQPDRMSRRATWAIVTAIIVVGVVIMLILAIVLSSTPGFTGARITADPSVSWNAEYWVSHGNDMHIGYFSGSGNGEYKIDCPSGYTMQVSITSYSGSLTAESWVNGEMRERNSGSYSMTVGAVC